MIILYSNTFHITYPDASVILSVFGFFFLNCDTTKIYEISKWSELLVMSSHRWSYSIVS